MLGVWSSLVTGFICACMRAKSLPATDSAALGTAARRAPLSTRFLRQEQWRPLPCPHPDCIHSGICMSVPVSQFFPLPLLCLVSVRSVCLCLCVCFADKLICISFLASTLMILYKVFLSATPLLCMTVSASIHLSADYRVLFLFVAE